MTTRHTVTAGVAAVLLVTACTTADEGERTPAGLDTASESTSAGPTRTTTSPPTPDDDPGGESVEVQDDVTIVVEEASPTAT